MSLTIRDIAKKSGVAVGTVSRVINGSAHVSDSAKARVMRCIDENNWTPVVSARTLSNGKSGLIGVVASNVDQYFHYRLLETLRRRLKTTEFGIMLSLAPTSLEIRKLKAAKVKCVIIISADDNIDDAVRELQEDGIPVLGLIGHKHFYPYANSDQEDAVFRGVAQLIGAGHSKIGFYGLFAFTDPGKPSRLTCCFNAYEGYRKAMLQHHLPFDKDSDFFSVPSTGALSCDLRERKHSAFFVYSWGAVMKFYIACRKEHILIPEDVSLAALECDNAAAALNPPPTHFVHNYEKYADIALDFINSDGASWSCSAPVKYSFAPGESIKIYRKEKK